MMNLFDVLGVGVVTGMLLRLIRPELDLGVGNDAAPSREGAI
jgi:hypothetical protein